MTGEAAAATAIDIAGLSVTYRFRGRHVRALMDVSFTSTSERRIAVVGESGSGKSTLGLAMLGLLPPSAIMAADRMLVAGQDVLGSSERERQRFRGRQLAMIFQDASASLDPLRTVGYQVAEPLKAHLDLDRRERAAEVARLLGAARIPDPLVRARQYPHQFSGGMRQRAMIASGLAGQPAVIVADEPTSALDVTTQSAILDLVRELGDARQMTTLLITHDLAVVAGFAETVIVLYAGRVVERGPVASVYTAAGHPYTRALLSAIPRIDGPRRAILGTIPGLLPDLTAESRGCVFEPRCWRGKGEERCREEAPALRRLTSGTVAACHFADDVAASEAALNYYTEQTPSVADAEGAGKSPPEPVLAISGLSKTFVRRGALGRSSYRTPAVSEVELTVQAGESVGIVGESGSGKTTVARLILGLEKRDGGTIAVRFNGAPLDIRSAPPTGYAQMVFQDPGDSLNPLMSVEEVISEPLSLRDHRSWRHYRQRVAELLADVGLSPDMARRRPHELSGGQRQRVAIARAIATEPQLIVADEAVASLDVSARGQILNLMRRLQRAHGFAYLHISHDLSLVRNICDRVVVMYGGRIVESSDVDELFAKPKHPYTQLLLEAVPTPDVNRSQADLARTRPNEYVETSYAELIAGCPFRSRCPLSDEKCADSMPPLAGPPQHTVACHHADAAIGLRRKQVTSDAPT